MRQIIKLQLHTNIEKQLEDKQKRIDNEEVKFRFDISPRQRKEITSLLFQAQKLLCCYCECRIDSFNYHLEHFYEKSDYPGKMYDYANFILSCEGEIADDTTRRQCGHAKEKKRHSGEEVNYDLLLNPMDDNTPLLFYNSAGKIVPITNNSIDIQRVEYTCNRLNLNNTSLVGKRVESIEAIEEVLQGLSLAEQKTYIVTLLDDSQTQLPAFYSTIKDNFAFLL